MFVLGDDSVPPGIENSCPVGLHGFSGRTVKPKLIITCGVSGAIQFVAGMNNSDMIISINEDPKAQIFDVAHYAIIGDIYEIIPGLIEQLKEMKKNR